MTQTTKNIFVVVLVVLLLAIFAAAYMRSQQMQADAIPSDTTQQPVADAPAVVPTPPTPAVEAGGSVSATPPNPAPTPVPTPPAPKKTPPPTPRVTVHHVTIKNYTFVPASLTIKAGDTVVWTNEDQASHTVALADGSFESVLIHTGESFSRTFTTAGNVPYACGPHPYMKASLIVTQ